MNTNRIFNSFSPVRGNKKAYCFFITILKVIRANIKFMIFFTVGHSCEWMNVFFDKSIQKLYFIVLEQKKVSLFTKYQPDFSLVIRAPFVNDLFVCFRLFYLNNIANF